MEHLTKTCPSELFATNDRGLTISGDKSKPTTSSRISLKYPQNQQFQTPFWHHFPPKLTRWSWVDQICSIQDCFLSDQLKGHDLVMLCQCAGPLSTMSFEHLQPQFFPQPETRNHFLFLRTPFVTSKKQPFPKALATSLCMLPQLVINDSFGCSYTIGTIVAL